MSPPPNNDNNNVTNERKSPPITTTITKTQSETTPHTTMKSESSSTLNSPPQTRQQTSSSFSSLSSSSSSSSSQQQQSKPIAKVVHFSPKIVQVDKPVFTDKPTTRVTRNTNKNNPKKGGMFVPPTPPPIKKPSSMTSFKDTPTQLTRVPRDQNIPLVVYNPPKIKPQSMGPPSSSQHRNQPAVLPVVPMTTVGGGNIIIARPLFASNDPTTHLHTPPTLISSSQLKKLTSKTQQRPSGAPNNKPSKKSSSSSSTSSTSMVSPTTPLAPYPCFAVHPPQLPMASPQLHPQGNHHDNKPIKMEPIEYSSNNNNNTNNNNYNGNGHDLQPQPAGDFRQWSVAEVYQHFCKSDCSKYADIFKDQVGSFSFLFCLSSLSNPASSTSKAY